MSVKPGEIVEVSCRIPNDIAKVHMVLVVSTDKISEVESGMFYGVMITSNPSNSEYKLEIKDDMLLKPLSKKSYFATHLMSFFESEDIIKHCSNALKSEEYLDTVINKIIQSIFDIELE